MATGYEEEQLTRDEVDATTGPVVVEFGTDWCGYCIAASRFIEPALAEQPQVRRIRVEDGKGRPLGRSYRVKLWPTLVFLQHGQQVARQVRPHEADAVAQALGQIAA